MKFTKIIKDEKRGRVFLQDEATLKGKKEELSRIAQSFAKPAEMLKRFDYPDKREWIEAVAFGGADALQSIILKENDGYAQKCGLPSFMARQIRKSAIQDAPKEIWIEADAIRAEISNLSAEYLIAREDITISDGGMAFDEDAVKARIDDALTREVPEAVLKEAELVRDIVQTICKMQDSGLCAIEVITTLCGNWIAPSQRPDINDDLYLLSLLLERRHPSRQQVKASNQEWYYLHGGE